MSLLGGLLAFCVAAIERLRDELDDAQLVKLAKRQDERGKEAFQVLVERHQAWLVAFLSHMLSNKDDAEELAQNVLVRAFFAIPKFRGESSFRTWLRTIATREAFSFYRKYGGRQDVAVEDIGDYGSYAPEQGRVDEREAIVQSLNRVPYPYREILVLRYVEEMSLEEIGASLELGKSATKMRLKRARDFFQEVYEEAGLLDEPTGGA